MPPSAFISYRRLPSAMLAQLIARELGEKYGIATYVDVRQSDGGGPFPDRLLRAIEAQDVFVCLLADITFESEWVRHEIAHAHNLGKTMIPVFQESYVPPADPDEHIRALLQYDGVQVLDRRNLYIDEAVRQLAQFIKTARPPIQQAPKQVEREVRARSSTGGRRSGLWTGLVLAALLVAAVVIVALLLSNGGGDGDKLDRTEVAQTVIAERSITPTVQAAPANSTETPTAAATLPPSPTLTPTLTAAPTLTPTPSIVATEPYAAGMLPLAEVSTGWAMNGGNPSNSSWNAAEHDLYPPLTRVWQWTPETSYEADRVTYADGIVYLSGSTNSRNTVYAVRVGEDRALWTYTLDEGAGSMMAEVAIGGGRAYFGGQGDDLLYIADAYTGAILNKIPGFGHFFTGSPKFDDDAVFACTEKCVAVSTANNGVVRWTVGEGGQISDALAGNIFLGGTRTSFSSNNLMAFDRDDGTILWRAAVSRGWQVVTDNRRAYAVTLSGIRVEAFDLLSGERAWVYGSDVNLGLARLAVTDTRLYVSGWDQGVLYMFDTATGELLGRIDLPYAGTSLAVANNVLYVGSQDLAVHAYDAATLELLWTETTGEYGPHSLAVADGYLFVAAGLDGVIAYR